jgi:UDP-N-acetylmuramate: L-alanyl-gamma-D-glutamyl-meso-diaminopimelate ligase
MHIHILGICGTFMGGIAMLAREMGHEVSGSDANVYPPMSTQLEQQGIRLMEGYEPRHLDPEPDMVVIGNAMSRGNPMVEYVLNRGLPYTSGPQWLAEHVLQGRWVLAVAGTHGKTTTASMLAWILDDCGLKPGFLIGGVPENFGVSARAGQEPFFVVEADEYDTAFFDKRSKFVHYRPRTLVINNLEFDHADIFEDLGAIQKQFHHLVRTVPQQGLIIHPQGVAAVDQTLAMGCWSPCESFIEGDWQADKISDDASSFRVSFKGEALGQVQWNLIGDHNMHNGVAAIAAARHAGVPAAEAMAALSRFENVKRRMEVRGQVAGITVYDDFAHHPTAIITTLAGLRARVGNARIIAVLEPRSNTMRMGIHKDQLADSLAAADEVLLYQAPDLDWSLQEAVQATDRHISVYTEIHAIVTQLGNMAVNGDHILVMSNGGFGGIHGLILERLQKQFGKATA